MDFNGVEDNNDSNSSESPNVHDLFLDIVNDVHCIEQYLCFKGYSPHLDKLLDGIINNVKNIKIQIKD